MDSATKYAVLNLPIPLTIIESDGIIAWYNPKFLDIIGCSDLLGRDIQEIVPSFDLGDILQDEDELSELIEINDRYFKIVYSIVKLSGEHASNYIIMLYWIEVTKYEELNKKYEDGQMVVESFMWTTMTSYARYR